MRRKITPCACLLLTLAVGSSSLRAQATHPLPAPAKSAAEPIECVGNRDVVLSNRFIRTSGHGVEVRGNCDVRIVDSHIVADGVGILVTSNSDVQVIDSFVQGARGAVVQDGNADATFRGSTFRGGTRATGNGEQIDAGGNTFETLSAEPPALLARGEPLSCGGRERLDVVGRYIASDGDAIVVEGRCEVLVSDSHIVARGAAIRVASRGLVRLRNSTVEGGEAAVHLDNYGYLHAAGSNIEGPIDLGAGSPRFADGGGNSIAGRGSRSASQVGRDPGRGQITIGPGGVEVGGSEAGGGGRISIGPDGIRIEGAGESGEAGTVEADAGGVEVRGSGRSVPQQPIETCGDLCDRWPGLAEEQWECVALVLELRGYPVSDTDVCIGVETRLHCGLCAEVLKTRDADCREVAERCLGG